MTSYYKDLDKIAVLAKAEKGFLSVFVLPYYAMINKLFINNELEFAIKNL